MPLDPILKHLAEGGAHAPMEEDLAALRADRAAARALALANRSRMKVKRTEDRQIEGREGLIGIRIYWPDTDSAAPAPLVVFYHGGGFARCDLETHDPIARAISAKAEAVVVSVDYRLAPEHPYPAAVHDSFDALRWSHEHAAELGANPLRVAVAGDSAGGNLAAVVTQLARDAGGPPLQYQLLWYPAVAFDLTLPSARENAQGPLLTLKDMELYSRCYFGDMATGDPADLPATAAPVNGNLAGLPPAYIATAQYDPIRDDGTMYAKLLAQAGVPVELHNAETLAHGYVGFAAAVPAAKEARDRALAALKAAL